MDLPTAMGLYDLTDSELFTEVQLDTRCLMAWSTTKIVLAFRGTASMKNAKADLQVSFERGGLQLPKASAADGLLLQAPVIASHKGHVQAQ